MDKQDRTTPEQSGFRPEPRNRYWFPLLLFGLITLAALPLYKAAEAGGPGDATLFWILALPLGYVATVIFYKRYADHRGSLVPFIGAGVALFATLVISMPEAGRALHLPRFLTTIIFRFPNLFIRGLTPLLVVAIGIVMLALVERSARLAVIAAAFLALAVTANLYNMSNVFQRLHWAVPDWATNLTVAGGFLVFAGLLSVIAPQARRGSAGPAIAS